MKCLVAIAENSNILAAFVVDKFTIEKGFTSEIIQFIKRAWKDACGVYYISFDEFEVTIGQPLKRIT